MLDLLPPAIREETRVLAGLAVPVAATQIGMMLMGVVDMMMIGPLGAEALAAASVGNALYLVVAIFALGVVMALDALIAQAHGAQQYDRAGDLLWQGMWLAGLLGCAVTAFFLTGRWMFDALGQMPVVAGLAADYVGPRALGAIAFLGFAACRGFLNGYGHMRPVMVIAVIANVVNVAADWALIYGHFGAPELGIAGAGYATAIVRWFMLGAVIVAVASPTYRDVTLRFRGPNADDLKRVLDIGAPIGGHQAAEMAVFSAAAVMAGWLGAVPQAAHHIAMTLAALAYHVPVGVSIATSVRVGQAIGQGRPDDAALAGRVGLGLGAVFMVLGAAVFIAIPGPLTDAFSPTPDVRALAIELLFVAAVFQVSDGIQVVAGGALRGAGDTRSSFWANVLAHWLVGLPLGAALAFWAGMGVHGLWWGLTASLTVAAGLLAWLFIRGSWRSIGKLV